ncbi:MAG TPA: ABC transporter permease subunit [Pirellulales bacterium]|jgi:NitT/TauT family transport system permease protein|nr:ABC transporter permease subunit [Pirellulales bacterium]
MSEDSTNQDSAPRDPAPQPLAAESRAAPANDAETAAVVPDSWLRRTIRESLTLRSPVPTGQGLVLALCCIGLVLGLWWFLTRGPTEERIVNPLTLPSISETFGAFPELWFDDALTRNTLTTLRRVALGFLLAGVVGVPLGVLAGCFPRIRAFLSPLVMFGRNIPLAAVLPLMIALFSEGETRKVMFIFIACVAFIISDTARAISDVRSQYVDTAFTLGAGRWQIISKVLIPTALPQVFDSFRILFGLAFGYIMLAESIKYANDFGGLGFLINTFQRTGKHECIYLIILIIPIVAFLVDRVLFLIQKQLFPHVYGGSGLLIRAIRVVFHAWDDLKRMVYQPPIPEAIASAQRASTIRQSTR